MEYIPNFKALKFGIYSKIRGTNIATSAKTKIPQTKTWGILTNDCNAIPKMKKMQKEKRVLEGVIAHLKFKT